jgi:hypothetical protein
LAKNSIKQIFNKDYNWLEVILAGSMKANIRKEMIGERPFSTTSAVIWYL